MNQSSKIFIDTSLIVSFIDRTDLNHLKASEIFDFLARQKYRVYTSSLIFFQTFSRLERSLGTVVSQDFLQAILESNIQVIYPQETDLVFCYRFYKNNKAKIVSLNEVLNAHLMEKHNIPNVVTFDGWNDLFGTKSSGLVSS